MPGRTAVEAFNAYADPLKSVLACISREPLRREVLERQLDENGISLQHFFFMNAPVRLKAPERNYAFHFDQYYRIVWSRELALYKVKTQSYTYTIEHDNTGEELFAFHWEPHSKTTFPHMHLGFGMRSHELPLDNKAHIPTGRVPIEDIVTFAIRELNVQSLCDDPEEIIGRARERFMEHKSW